MEKLQPEQKSYQGLSAAQRFERLVFVVAFVGLALTGLSQKFAAESWGNALIVLLGGIESARILHRFFAILLIAATSFHLMTVGYQRFVLVRTAPLFPGVRDWLGLGGRFLQNLGLKSASGSPPDTRFALRIRYLVLVISSLILIVTGLILWNPVAVTNSLPGETIPVTRSLHSDHALLFVVFMVIWQFLIVFMWRPKPDDGGQTGQTVSAAEIKRRRWRFLPAAILISGLLAAGLGWFFSFETTAINTVPRRQEAVFAPQMMPEAGDAHVGEALWSTLRCAFCHGEQADGGANGEPALRQSELTLDTFYDRVRNGKGEMPAFGPEELPDGYLLHLWTWLGTTP